MEDRWPAPKRASWDTVRDSSAPCTHAELAVLRCFSHGLERAEAADALGKSVETVKTQAMSARYRLRAKNTAHACCIALRLGLID